MQLRNYLDGEKMDSIIVYESIVGEDIKAEIKAADWCADLLQYSTFKCKIDGLVASAYLFCPQIVQIKDYIFIKQFWNCSEEESAEYIASLEERYGNDKKLIEMSVNTWSIGDFFVGESSELMDNKKVVQQFGNALVYFWTCRVKNLFPARDIVVELGENLMGEMGLCITMYETNGKVG